MALIIGASAMQSVLLQKSYSLNEFARQNAIGLTTVRGEIKAGRLVARKVGREQSSGRGSTTPAVKKKGGRWVASPAALASRAGRLSSVQIGAAAVAAAGASKRSRGRNST